MALALITTTAFSQEKSGAAQDSTQQKFDVDQRKQDVQIFLDKVEILGRIEKPQTVFIVPGQDPTVDDVQIDRSFFQEIFRPVAWDLIKKIVEKHKSSK